MDPQHGFELAIFTAPAGTRPVGPSSEPGRTGQQRAPKAPMTCHSLSIVSTGREPSSTRSISPRNRLLAALPEEDLERLSPHLEPVALKRRQVLHRPRAPVEHLYFVEDCLVSVVAEAPGEKPVEVWLIGPEGLAGAPFLLGDVRSTHSRIVQVPGRALRIASDRLQEAFDESHTLRKVLLRWLHAVLVQTSLLGACNIRHGLEQRLARWLLMARDRLEADDLPFTHEILSLMLSVRRAGVTEALASLERKGLVQHHRGHVILRDRNGLQSVSCGCYAHIQAAYDQVLCSTCEPSDPQADRGARLAG